MGWKKDKTLKACSSGCELSVCDQGRECSTRQEEPMAEPGQGLTEHAGMKMAPLPGKHLQSSVHNEFRFAGVL